jgi:large subunit ribosomal protein L6
MIKMNKEEKEKPMTLNIELPEGVSAKVFDNTITITGPKGEVKKKLSNPRTEINVSDSKIIISGKKATKQEKKIIGTFAAHIKNIIRGVTEGHWFVLKLCAGLFPMIVAKIDDQLIVKNFFGEKIPRILKLKKDASVKVEGDLIIVESTNKELAGQVSSDIEQLTRRPNYDGRIFQDGIWLINKDGKEIK